jgi:hypothetical protein
MKKKALIFVSAITAVAVIYAAPIAYEFAIRSPEHGLFVDPRFVCTCGHRNYYSISGGFVVSQCFGHNDSREFFSAQKVAPNTYTLKYYKDGSISRLILSREFLTFEFKDTVCQMPRVWHFWPLWFERILYRNVPPDRKSFSELSRHL